MGLKFRRSVKICKGVRMNFSGSGVGISIGGRGCRYSISSRGRRTTTFGIPGTGLSYSTSSGGTRRKKNSRKQVTSSKGRVRSYSSAAYRRKQEIQHQRALTEKNRQNELKMNQLKVEEHENYLDVIRSVHIECDDEMNWNEIMSQPEPFAEGTTGPNEVNAQNAYDSFTPNFIERIIKSLGEKRKQQLYEDISSAHNLDIEEYQNWRESKEFAEQILNGNIDAYLEAINEANPFEDFSDYGSDFEFGTDRSDYIEIEFRVKSKEVVPLNILSLTKTGKISEKAMSKTMYYDITQDYVCSCAIRLAREMFALLPINKVIVHAVDYEVNTSSGNDEDITILSVLFEKNGFSNINFERIDASDFVSTFNNHMKFMKTSGFRAVERISIGDY